jgi:hypothetical protein
LTPVWELENQVSRLESQRLQQVMSSVLPGVAVSARFGSFRTRLVASATAILIVAMPARSAAQVNTQLWVDVTLEWIRSAHLTYAVDFQPKVLLSRPEGDPGWYTVDVTPKADYAWKSWLDLIGDLKLGPTHQTDEVDTFELTPRIGARFHLLSRNVPDFVGFFRERTPSHRMQLNDLVRIEWRNLFSESQPDQSTARFRNRVELSYTLNRPKATDIGATSFQADWEWFLPVSDVQERFANEQRIRSGVGHRFSASWQFEFLYAWTRSRATIEDNFTTSDNIFNVRVKRVFH